jgi:hypothetical protein
MWCVDPRSMCRAHLLGEHRELHAIAGMTRQVARGVEACKEGLIGHINAGQVDLSLLVARHSLLVAEMRRRGWPSGVKHDTPLKFEDVYRSPSIPWVGHVDGVKNHKELIARCGLCRELAVLMESQV